MGSLIAGIASTIVGGIQERKNRKAQYNINKRNQEHDFDVMNYQNELNLQQWNRQNEYDSPSAQMQRYQDAGLNPNLIYSQMSECSTMAPISAENTPAQAYQSDNRVSTSLSNIASLLSASESQDKEIAYQRDLAQKELEETIRHNMKMEGASEREIDESINKRLSDEKKTLWTLENDWNKFDREYNLRSLDLQYKMQTDQRNEKHWRQEFEETKKNNAIQRENLALQILSARLNMPVDEVKREFIKWKSTAETKAIKEWERMLNDEDGSFTLRGLLYGAGETVGRIFESMLGK